MIESAKFQVRFKGVDGRRASLGSTRPAVFASHLNQTGPAGPAERLVDRFAVTRELTQRECS